MYVREPVVAFLFSLEWVVGWLVGWLGYRIKLALQKYLQPSWVSRFLIGGVRV